MNNIFGGGVFGNNQTTMDQMRQQLEMQMAQYNKMQQAQQQQQLSAPGIMDEFKGLISSLNQEEAALLNSNKEFVNAKTLYEQGFMEFLSTKFAAEYIDTPVGKQSVENLTETTKMSLKGIRDATAERSRKLEAIAELLESDPDIRRKIEEKTKAEK